MHFSYLFPLLKLKTWGERNNSPHAIDCLSIFQIIIAINCVAYVQYDRESSLKIFIATALQVQLTVITQKLSAAKSEGNIVQPLYICGALVAYRLHFGDLLGAEAVKLTVLEFFLVHLVSGKRKAYIVADYLTVDLGNDNVALSLKQQIDRENSHFGSGQTVAQGGIAAADYMGKSCKLCLNSGLFAYLLGKDLTVRLALVGEHAL